MKGPDWLRQLASRIIQLAPVTFLRRPLAPGSSKRPGLHARAILVVTKTLRFRGI